MCGGGIVTDGARGNDVGTLLAVNSVRIIPVNMCCGCAGCRCRQL